MPPRRTTTTRALVALAVVTHAAAFTPTAPTRLAAAAAGASRGRAPPLPVAFDRDAEPEPLFFVDRTWRRGSCMAKADKERAEAQSEATMVEGEGVGGSGSMAWSMRVPITFDYRVVEAPGLLEVGNDALVYGHMAHADAAAARNTSQRRLVVVDEVVDGLYGERLRAVLDAVPLLEYKYVALPMQESDKDMNLVLKVADAMTEYDLDRRSEPVLAIGGGVTLDVVGLACTLYRRKMPWIRVPTTLLAYVDASVGAKTGVNFGGAKNRLGAYVPPTAALLDPVFFATQTERETAQGLSEIVKMALAKDRELFDLLEAHGPRLLHERFRPNHDGDTVPAEVLRHSISTMLEELTPNLWEQSLTRLVDLGHIFGHEIEMANLEHIQHGEAVAMDMALCTVLSMQRGHLSRPEAVRVLKMMRAMKLPLTHKLVSDELLRESLHARRKASMGLKLPLPVAIGRCDIFEDVDEEQVVAAHHELRRMENSLRLQDARAADAKLPPVPPVVSRNAPTPVREPVHEQVPMPRPVFFASNNDAVEL